MTITKFLLARIAEDEARANDRWRASRKLDGYQVEFDSMMGHAVRHSGSEYTAYFRPDQFRDQFMEHHPDKRVLAECAARRAIIEPFEKLANGRDRHFDAYQHATYKMLLRGVIAPLAAVYKDHPDYQPEWVE
jgi:hypothetical protein